MDASARETSAVEADAKPCGPGAATLASSFPAMIREATGAREPVPRGEPGISVNTIAQGRSGLSG
jgi:hypothetical protein